jgi:hypothetical protein
MHQAEETRKRRIDLSSDAAERQLTAGRDRTNAKLLPKCMDPARNRVFSIYEVHVQIP